MITWNSYPNVPFMSYLPCGMTTFGGDTQIFTIDPEILCGSNIGFCLNPIAQGMMGYNNLGWNIGYSQQYDIGAIVGNCATPVLNEMATQNIKSSMNYITSMKTRLNSLKIQDGVTAEQVAQIDELLAKLDEQEKQLKELMENPENIDVGDAYKKAAAVENELRKIATEAAKIRISNSAPSSNEEPNNESDPSNDAAAPGAATNNSNNASNSESANNSNEPNGTHELKVNHTNAIKDDIETFYNATYRWGTDDEALLSVVEKITADNVMDYMTAWNRYHSGEQGETFIDAYINDISDDCFNPNEERLMNGLKLIKRALRDKAEQLGIYDDLAGDFTEIDKRMGRYFQLWDNYEKIAKAFNKIIEAIGKKMGGEYEKLSKVQN